MTTSEDYAAVNRPFKVDFELAEGLAWTIREQAPWRELIKKLGDRVPDRDKLPLTLELSVGDHPLVRVDCFAKGPGMWSLHQNWCDGHNAPDPDRYPLVSGDDVL